MSSSFDHTSNISQALARLRLRKAPRNILNDYAATLLAHSESPEREDLIRLISLDPLMAVWILKRANGSYYGLRSMVDSVSRAIDVLEESAIAGMFADTFGAQTISQKDLPSSSPDALTRHSVATAIISTLMASGDLRTRGFAFTAGLLHDIGKHVFALNFPEEAAKMYCNSSLWDSLQGTDLISVEQLAFGIDHREVGEFIARKMYFPEILTDVLRTHAKPSSLPSSHAAFQMACIVNAASLAATAMGYAAGEPVSWEQCSADARWDKLTTGRLVDWDQTQSLLSDIEATRSSIEEFLEFEVNRSKTLMNSDSQPKRMDREPVNSGRKSSCERRNRGQRKQS